MSIPITSPQNQRIKDAVKLRDHRGRRKQGRIIIDGARETLRAIEAGVDLVELFVCHQLCQSDESQRVVGAAGDTAADVFDLTPNVFQKLAYGERHDGIVAVATTPQHDLAACQPTAGALIAVLESVEKPGNVGAVIRTADAAGVSAVIVADGGTDLYNPNAIRASLGTIFSLPVFDAASNDVIAWLRERNFHVVAARVDADVNYTDADFTRATAIVLGSEAAGLSGAWLGQQVTAVKLPMLGTVDSLNVSATAAILFYEAQRQRSRPTHAT
jgi:TrmH family RNA methyltransferase